MTGWLHHIRTEPHKVLNPGPAASFKASIPAQISIKRPFLTKDKRQVSHRNMIGCPLSCCVHGQHQAHRSLEHYTSAIKWASGQYQVIGPIQTECLIYSDHQSMEADVFTTYVEITAGVNIAALLYILYFTSYSSAKATMPYGCVLKIDSAPQTKMTRRKEVKHGMWEPQHHCSFSQSWWKL